MTVHVVLWLAMSAGAAVDGPDQQALESIARGRELVWTTSSPLNGSMFAWNTVWKAWGLTEPPENPGEELFKRYGLFPSPRAGDSMPLGLTSVKVPLRDQLGNNCLMCHASRIAGRTIIGAGNASLDLQTLTDDLQKLDPLAIAVPFHIGRQRGTVEAVAGTVYLLQYRDRDLNIRLPKSLHFEDDLRNDIPAWWHRRRKKTIFHTGSTHTMSVRANLSFLLAPIFDGEFIKSQESAYKDIRNYMLTLQPPEYPFEVDADLARAGEAVFAANCAECHGTYGPDGEYPNRIIPLDEIGTDPRLSRSYAPADADYYRESWLSRETGPDGEPWHGLNFEGYQAPPLDGLWATAPYFHNASVPTVEHVLNSEKRPRIFTRSYETDEDDYDKRRLGWKTTDVPEDALKAMTARERRGVYDTRISGCSNAGHTYGDHLTDIERQQVIEYLKTL